MALPPDPHDDDLAEPPAPPPPAVPPAPAAEAGGEPAAPAATEPPAPVEPTVAPPTTSPSPAAAATAVTDAPPAPGGPAAGSPVPPATSGGGRGRLGVMLVGVVAVIAIAGGVVLATGSSDDTAAPPADTEQEGDPAPDSGGKGDAPGGATDDAPDDGRPGDDAATDEPAAGDSETSTSDETPVEAAEEFFAAVNAQDCADIVGRMTPESFGREGQTADEAIAECQADAAGTAMASAADYAEIELVAEDGDEAIVSVTVTMGAQESERALPMRRVDGRWLMHLDTSLVTPAG